MRCHPIRWLWGLIPVAMLSWLAVHLKSAPWSAISEQRSGAALAAAGHRLGVRGFFRSRRLAGRAAPSARTSATRRRLSCAMYGACVPSRRASRFRRPLPHRRRGRLPESQRRGFASPLPRRRGRSRHTQPSGTWRQARSRSRTGKFAALPTIRRNRPCMRGTKPNATALPVATLPVPQAADTQPPASAQPPAVAATAPLPEHKPTPAEPVSPAIAADVPEVPARKPEVAEAPPGSVAAASPTPPVPEVKPEPVTAPVPPAAAPAANRAAETGTGD